MHVSRQILALSILALFVGVATFGLYASMMADQDGNMSDCPLMNGMSSMCRMNIMEHISQWQQMFATAIPSGLSLAILLAMGFLSFLFLARDNLHNREQLNQKIAFTQINQNSFQILSYLSFAFSRGILHAKIYDHPFIP